MGGRGQVILKCDYITSWLSLPNAHTHNEREREKYGSLDLPTMVSSLGITTISKGQSCDGKR